MSDTLQDRLHGIAAMFWQSGITKDDKMACDAMHEAARRIDKLERDLAAAQAKLARYEQAKMPEEATKYYPHDEELTLDGFVWVHWGDYETLRTFAAAQTVRAEENERQLERECLDGDKITNLLCIPRTEGGSLQVAKIINAISDAGARLKIADEKIASYEAALKEPKT